MVTWTQMYMPMGGLGLSALVALIPIIFFFVALAVLRLKGHVAGAITLILSILIAIFAFKMPIDMAFAAAGYGFIYGLWPIAWIIVAAVFLYKLTVASGQFDIIRSSVISITDDQRLQVLLIGFSFGALLEGAAGFGAPVAITGALLVGLGFKPLYAAGLCLIANTAPVAFGALGVPILRLSMVTPCCFAISSAISLAVTEPNRRPPAPALALMMIFLSFILATFSRAACISRSILCCLEACSFFSSFMAWLVASTASLRLSRKFWA